MNFDWGKFSVPVGSEPLYARLWHGLATEIDAGRLRPGERLIPQRELAALLGIAPGVVARAYQQLGRQGQVEAEVGSGTYVRTAPRPNSRTIVDLTINSAPFQPISQRLAAFFATLSRTGDLADLCIYGDPVGAPQHRALFARWLAARGVPATAETTFVSAGGHAALVAAAHAFLTDGQIVGVEPYVWPGLLRLRALFNLRFAIVEADENGMRPDALARAVRDHRVSAVALAPTLSNPSLHTMPAARRREIVDTINRRDLLLIEDDVGREISPSAPQPLSETARHYVYFTTFSKYGWANGRAGPVCVSLDLVDRYASALAASQAQPGQLGAEFHARLIASGELDTLRDEIGAFLTERRTAVEQILGPLGAVTAPGALHFLVPGLPETAVIGGSELQTLSLARLAVDGADVSGSTRVSYGAQLSREDFGKLLQGICGLIADHDRGHVLPVS